MPPGIGYPNAPQEDWIERAKKWAVRKLYGMESDGSEFGASTAPMSGGNIDRQQQIARRGQADATVGNLVKAGTFGLSVAGGMAPVTLGLQGLGHLAAPDLIGSPLPAFEGSEVLDKKYRDMIGTRFATSQEAFAAQRADRDRDRLGRAQTMGRAAAASRAAGGMSTRGGVGGVGRSGGDPGGAGKRAGGTGPK